eukprot:CAMPEP_0172561242 /NCGR_PEP_ID=MMETSP1067-20121228/92100_1 /TAXON_ID=265564 ORGANISM="Thalassiosira punctigera, Strain Tpunct2005C2" /NCGR_SAMPLE_ID=MMETSP1067 /ASSEMBLY_ACC=CAM_ASM_000444 /LENGTH=955 /DNA_ID=CAMNT_0013351245 /DNA_START=210 /DNA_END=3074 /DNA_ORIENTATION=-
MTATEMKVDEQSSTDVEDPAFVSSLREPLRGYASRAFSPPSPTDDGDRNEEAIRGDATSKLDELEISTRSHLLELVERFLSVSSSSEDENAAASSSAVETLLRYLKDATLLCLHVARHHSAKDERKRYSHIPSIAAVKKLPFLLLEDAIDSLPLVHVQSLWSSPRFPDLCVSGYTTNLLCSPPIFVPASRLILLRICNKLLKVLSNRDVDAEFAGSLMMTTARVFPLSERSAVNVLGSFNVENETAYEDEGEFSGKTNVLGQRGEEEDGKSKNIGYDFYRTFWGVQRVFTDPQGTILPSRGGPSQAQAAAAYNGFMKDVTSILVALESTPVPKSSSSSKPQLDDATTAGAVRHHKYLTSSQLLHLQLKDAKLRVQFLTQLIIILSYLGSPVVALPTPPVAPAPGSDVTKLSVQIKSTQTKQMNDASRWAQQLLRSTSPPLGESMLRSLQWLLRERESLWRNWKKNKCFPPMDKVGESTASGTAIRMKLGGRKRKAVDEGRGGGKDVINIDSLPETRLPALASFFDPYVEALDPENGIEGEYHPRNDKVYCWRALRLMARDQQGEGELRRFGKLRRKDGDFEGIVREMWKDMGKDIGGEMPVNYYDDVEGGNGNGEIAKAADSEMDDAASVGTPEEDLQAKKEQMAEFEKAAMEVEEEMLNEEASEGSDADMKGVMKEEGDERSAKEKDKKESCAIHDAAAETIESMFNEEPKKEPVVINKEPSVREEPKPSKFEMSATKARLTTETENVGKRDENRWAPKDEAIKTRLPATAAPIVSSNGRKDVYPRSASPPRAKFTPPQKVQQQQQPKMEPRDNYRGRFGHKRRNSDDRTTDRSTDRTSGDQQQWQSRPPSEGNRDGGGTDGRGTTRGGGRTQDRWGAAVSSSSDRHHGGSLKSKDNGRDASKRDTKSLSPPNNTTAGGTNLNVNPPPSKGSDGSAGGGDRSGDRRAGGAGRGG